LFGADGGVRAISVAIGGLQKLNRIQSVKC